MIFLEVVFNLLLTLFVHGVLVCGILFYLFLFLTRDTRKND